MKTIVAVLFLGICLSTITAQENKRDPRIISIIESIVPDTVYVNEPFFIAHKIQGNFRNNKIRKSKYENRIGLDSITTPKWLHVRFFNYIEDKNSKGIDISDLPDIEVLEYYLVNELRANKTGLISLPSLIVEYAKEQIITKVISEEKEIVVLPSRPMDKPQFEVLLEAPGRISECWDKFKFTIKVKSHYSSDLKDIELNLKKLEKYLTSKFKIIQPRQERIAVLNPYLDRGGKLQIESYNIYEWVLKPTKAMDIKLPEVELKFKSQRQSYPLPAFTVHKCKNTPPAPEMGPLL